MPESESYDSQIVYDPYKPSTLANQRTGMNPPAVKVSPYAPGPAVVSYSPGTTTSTVQTPMYTPNAATIPYPEVVKGPALNEKTGLGSSVTSGQLSRPASHYRPKTYNAYDPPLPTVKSTKRSRNLTSPTPLSPSFQQDMYGTLPFQSETQAAASVSPSSSYFPSTHQGLNQGFRPAVIPPLGQATKMDWSQGQHERDNRYMANELADDHRDNEDESRSPQLQSVYYSHGEQYATQEADLTSPGNTTGFGMQDPGNHHWLTPDDERTTNGLDHRRPTFPEENESGWTSAEPSRDSESGLRESSVGRKDFADSYSSTPSTVTSPTIHHEEVHQFYMPPTNSSHSPDAYDQFSNEPSGGPPYEPHPSPSRRTTRSPGNTSIRAWTHYQGSGSEERQKALESHQTVSPSSSDSAARSHVYEVLPNASSGSQPYAYAPQRAVSPSRSSVRSSTRSPGKELNIQMLHAKQ